MVGKEFGGIMKELIDMVMEIVCPVCLYDSGMLECPLTREEQLECKQRSMAIDIIKLLEKELPSRFS